MSTEWGGPPVGREEGSKSAGILGTTNEQDKVQGEKGNFSFSFKKRRGEILPEASPKTLPPFLLARIGTLDPSCCQGK